MIFLLIFLTSCSVNSLTAPSFSINYAGKKVDLRIALIISDELRNEVHETIIYSACGRRNGIPATGYNYRFGGMFDFLKRGVIRAENAVGMGNEELLTKGLPVLFNKVDIYKDITEIKNKGDYDYILVPHLKIVTSYDKEEALNRGVRLYPLYRIEGDPIWISASVEYRLEVRDARNGVYTTAFIGNGSITGAKMCLLSQSAMNRADEIAQKMNCIDLSADTEFMNNYTASLFLPHTNLDLFPSIKARETDAKKKNAERTRKNI